MWNESCGDLNKNHFAWRGRFENQNRLGNVAQLEPKKNVGTQEKCFLLKSNVVLCSAKHNVHICKEDVIRFPPGERPAFDTWVAHCHRVKKLLKHFLECFQVVLHNFCPLFPGFSNRPQFSSGMGACPLRRWSPRWSHARSS